MTHSTMAPATQTAAAARPQPPSNPFATRWVRPGAIEYIFPEGDSAEGVVARLADAGWRGQIIGPHGAGKSTLLAALLPALEAAGRKVDVVRLHNGQRSLPDGYRALFTPARSASEGNPRSIPRFRFGLVWARWKADCPRSRFGLVWPGDESGLLVVDGYEQLRRWERLWLRWHCRRRGYGLLATAHADVGLPTVAEVRPGLEMAERLVAELLAAYPPEAIPADEVRRAFARHGGNIRETLFALYDVYETSRGTDRRLACGATTNGR